MSQTDDRMVAALLRERESYQRQGKPDRVAQVEEQLRLRGWTDPKPERDDHSNVADDESGSESDSPSEERPAEAEQPSDDSGGETVDRTPPKGRRGASRRTT